MFALALLMPQTVLGADRFCMDIENGNPFEFESDDVYEETGSEICVWQDGYESLGKCRQGLKRDEYDEEYGCIEFTDGTLKDGVAIKVSTNGRDAAWIDRFRVESTWTPEDGVFWGWSNSAGWCLSQDLNDHIGFNDHHYSQYVPANKCYHTLRLNPSTKTGTQGTVTGFYDGTQQKRCREEKKMDCKEGCDDGWKHIRTSNHGCCSSFGSCGGNMKTCERYYDCRRRTEDQVANSTTEVIPTVTTTVHPSGRNETGYWVDVTPERMEDIAVRVEELRAPRRRKTKPLKLE